jgi:type VI protein secretion system component VasF
MAKPHEAARVKPDLEEQLREALRPLEPPAGFAARVAARIENERRQWPRWQPLRTWVPAALAASVLASVVLGYGWELRRERQGLEARQQLIEALRLTGEKLDLAYRGVRDASKRADAADAGDT